MIQVGNVLLSDDIAEKEFVCNLNRCKGACCVEGDLGAPLDESELPIFEEIYPYVEPYLTEEGKRVIEKEGMYIKDWEGDFSTTTINNRECTFAIKDEKGVLSCGIEKAFLDGKIQYRKPISCHLYPIRVTRLREFVAVNYHKWDICAPACQLGEKLSVPLYKFLKDPLIRSFGDEWYNELTEKIEGKASE